MRKGLYWVIWGLYRGIISDIYIYIYWDSGKENGNYFLGFRVRDEASFSEIMQHPRIFFRCRTGAMVPGAAYLGKSDVDSEYVYSRWFGHDWLLM